jgi:sulfofructose kinase
MSSGDAVNREHPRLLCAGIAVCDQIFAVDAFPTPHVKTRAHTFTVVSGGCAANAAIAAARLGARVRLSAPLGGPAGLDAIGDRILATLAAENVDCSACIRINGVFSPISAIMIDPAGERVIVNYRDDRLSAARPAGASRLVETADVVLIDNRFPEFVLPIGEAAQAGGLPIILDADQPTRQTDTLLRLATHVVFSAEGLRATASEKNLALALRRLGKHAPGFLAVTNGADDILWLEGDDVCRLPAHRIKAIDTLGAGDVFHGAFALALAHGRTPVAALRFATTVAAIKCTRLGGIAGAPRAEEVETFLSKGG